MANKNVNFANREVANLMISEYSTKKQFLYVDWANVSSTSFEAERVFATGGQGAPNRVQFDSQRTGTLTVEAQVYPAKVFQMLSGNDMATAADVLKRERLTATAEGLTLAETPVGTSVQVFAADDDCGTPIEASLADKIVTGDEITEDNDYIVYYFTNVTDAMVIKFDANHFPRAYRVEAEVPFKREDDVIVQSRHIWYKCAPQGAFELSWQNTGDPASITLTFDVMADDQLRIYDQVFPNVTE